MNFPPILDIPLYSNLPELSQVILPSKEEDIDALILKLEETKERSLLQAKSSLDQIVYKQFESHLSNLTHRIVWIIKEMKIRDYDPELILKMARYGLSEIDTSRDKFLKARESYEFQKKQTLEKVDSMKSKIDQLPSFRAFPDFSQPIPTHENFSDFMKKMLALEPMYLSPKTNIQENNSPKESQSKDPILNLKKFQYEENAALAHLTATALNGISTVFEKSLEAAARGVCYVQLEPVTRNACHQLVDNLTRSEPREVENTPSSAAIVLEDVFSIPREVTQQYERDHAVIGQHVIAGAASYGLGRVVTTVTKSLTVKVGNPAVKQTNKVMSERVYSPCIKDKSGYNKLQIERDYYIKLFLDLGYQKSKGGKGSHLKLTKPDSPMVIIPIKKDLNIKTAKDLKQNYERAKAAEMLNLMPLKLKKPDEKSITSFSYDKPFSHRADYNLGYLESTKCFVKSKEFNGLLSKDLMIVRFSHVNPERTQLYRWWLPVSEANKFWTLEEMNNSVARLTKFGEITHVSIARVPAGEPVRFLHGKTAQQLDALSNEVRLGGGTQYRFFDFDIKWILQTRELPK